MTFLHWRLKHDAHHKVLDLGRKQTSASSSSEVYNKLRWLMKESLVYFQGMAVPCIRSDPWKLLSHAERSQKGSKQSPQACNDTLLAEITSCRCASANMVVRVAAPPARGLWQPWLSPLAQEIVGCFACTSRITCHAKFISPSNLLAIRSALQLMQMEKHLHYRPGVMRLPSRPDHRQQAFS